MMIEVLEAFWELSADMGVYILFGLLAAGVLHQMIREEIFMCLIVALVFCVMSFSFFSQGLIPHALFSGFIALVLLFYFFRKIFANGRCIFGTADDCNTKDDVR